MEQNVGVFGLFRSCTAQFGGVALRVWRYGAAILGAAEQQRYILGAAALSRHSARTDFENGVSHSLLV